MLPELAQALRHGTAEYAELPEPVRQYYSEREYLFIPDDRRARLIQEETEPDCFEDGV